MHKALTKWMWRLLMHLDRGVVISLELQPITSSALQSFKNIVFTCMHPIINAQLFQLIDEMRKSGRDDHCLLIKDCLEVSKNKLSEKFSFKFSSVELC